MTTRITMPDRRSTMRQKVTIGRRKLYLDVGFYDDGRVGELFITVERTGSQERWLFDALARCASLALQCGASLDRVAEQWLGTMGKPFGPVQGDDRIKNCRSPLDYIARHLLVHYCGREDLAHTHLQST